MSRRFIYHFSGFTFVLLVILGDSSFLRLREASCDTIPGEPCYLPFDDENMIEQCWLCICKASSSCNTNSGCTKPYFGAYSCGLLSISWLYWVDAGGPRLDKDKDLPSEIAFENCVKEKFCAVQTVCLYVTKFRADCDGNTGFTCEDVIRIHIMGGYACNDKNVIKDQRYKAYTTCMKSNLFKLI
ncbi:invertebrate-type lysozyme 3-like [Palaemon carinicauda]|uniref:invertebrate-type lysozyme 3-like n=1 Tax=Palaemon carinicauda TaxID=392227 RepID=UPI0035B6A137